MHPHKPCVQGSLSQRNEREKSGTLFTFLFYRFLAFHKGKKIFWISWLSLKKEVQAKQKIFLAQTLYPIAVPTGCCNGLPILPESSRKQKEALANLVRKGPLLVLVLLSVSSFRFLFGCFIITFFFLLYFPHVTTCGDCVTTSLPFLLSKLLKKLKFTLKLEAVCSFCG